MIKTKPVGDVANSVISAGYFHLGEPTTRTCPHCGQKYEHRTNEIEYIYNRKKFCSFTCKMRFIKSKKNEAKK